MARLKAHTVPGLNESRLPPQAHHDVYSTGAKGPLLGERTPQNPVANGGGAARVGADAESAKRQNLRLRLSPVRIRPTATAIVIFGGQNLLRQLREWPKLRAGHDGA